MAKLIGTVKWFNDAVGCGVIVNELNEEVFVQDQAIQNDEFKTLVKGEKVEFLQVRGERGWLALKVTKLE